MPSLRFGRFGLPAVLGVASAGLAAMVFMLRALALRSVPQTFIDDESGRVVWAARDSVHTAWLADSLPTLLERLRGYTGPP